MTLPGLGLHAQTYTFTTAGATGRFGPTQTQVTAAYNNTNLGSQVTSNNGVQQWVVPQSGWYTINGCGAQGGNKTSTYVGGLGACMQGDFFLAQGTILNILVGQQGETSGNNTGGGGGSFIWINGQTTEPLIAAGGGGGAGFSANGTAADTGTAGQNGTGAAGTPGTGGNGATPGGAGWKSDGGNYNANTSCAVKCAGNAVGITVGGASPLTTIVYHGCAGSSATGDGGFGGASGGNGNCTSSHGGGGGGGYSGGVGQTGSSAGGGGAGSYNAGTNQVNIPGMKSGDGEIVINFVGGSTPDNAGITSLPSLAGTSCPGTVPVTATVVNFGNNKLDSVFIGWSVNGVNQTGQWFVFNPPLDTAGSSANNTVVNLGSFTLAANTPTTVKAWTSLPNNTIDTLNANDTTTASLQAAMGGSYTINSGLPAGGTNFTSFTSFVNAVTQSGICSPIVVAVTGSYDEQVDISQIQGSSSVNTLTFNGATGSDTLKNAGSTLSYATLSLNGADYVSFNNLNIVATGATTGFAVHLSNGADNNTFDSCNIFASPTATGTTTGGVIMSGSQTSYSTAGGNGSNNTFSYCNVTGGYFGFSFYGNATSANSNNSILNCHVKDYYVYGSYNLQQGSGVISNNIFERPTRTTVSTFYAVMVSTGCSNMLVEKNWARNPAGTSTSASFTAYPFYCSSTGASVGNENKFFNNMVAGFNGIGVRGGFYFPSATHVQIYHNTIVFDHTAQAASTFYGIYSTGAVGVDVKNNNIVITQPNTGTKYLLYFSGAGKTSNYNNLYIASTGGTNYVGYSSTASPTTYTSLTTWKTANTNSFDQNSLDVDPLFASPASGNYTPTNSLVDDAGTPLGVTTDINGMTRSVTTPDMGAIEFSVAPCAGNPTAGTATAVGNITAACNGGSVSLTLAGFSIGSGISIQWEESPSGAGFWTNIAGATSAATTVTFAGATDYRAVVTCANGGGFDVSNTVSINANPFYVCYCSPNTGTNLHSSFGNYITNVVIPTTTLSSPSSAVGPGGYTLKDHTVPANTTSLVQGQTYTLNASISSATYSTELWIDWNQDGLFDATEYTLLTPGTNSTTTFQVPTTSVAGLTGMRLRTITSATVKYNDTGACFLVATASETEDYVITIIQGIPCSGIPSMTGTISSSSDTICNGSAVSFTYANYPQELGLSFQWQSSPAGQNNFTAIPNATGFSHNSGPLSANTDFRVEVTCNNPGGGSGYTNVKTIVVNNPQLVSTSGATRCGTGTVTLTATANGGNNVNWYGDATGGSILGSGGSFVTPVIASTDTFYAAASSGSGGGSVPELMYYRFDLPGTTVANEASSPVGNNPATVTGLTIGGTGQFGTGLQGAAGPTATNNVNPGWTGTHNGSWTISFWMDVPTPPTTRYMFGNSSGNGSFRCFIGGAANGIRLTGGVPSVTLDMPNWLPGTSVVTYVYDATLGTVSGYINGVFQASVSPGSSYPLDGTNFVVGSHGTSIDGTMDEFRMYNRALSAGEIASTFSVPLGGCEGSRVPVVATVTPPPAYTLSATPPTICTAGSSTISISSANNYTYTWTPTGSGSSFSVSPTTTTKYYVSGTDGNNCSILDSITINVVSPPPALTATAVPGSICVGGNTTVSVTPTPMPGLTIQWEKNTGAGYTAIPGATNPTYTEPVTATTYYRAQISCNSNVVATSSVDTVEYNNPTFLNTFPGSRCGPGPVTLAVQPPTGVTTKWYDALTGGNQVGSGNAYTSPTITNSTTYYAEPTSGLGGNDSVAVPIGNGTTTGVYFHMFMMSTTSGLTLNTIGIKCNQAVNTATAWDIYYRPDNYQLVPGANTSSAGWTLLSSVTNVPSQGAAAYTTIATNLGLVMPPNTTYSFHIAPGTGTTHQYATNAMGTITGSNAHASIIAGHRGSLFNCGTTAGQAVVSMGYSLGCSGTRVPVAATINPAASGTGLATGGTTTGASQGASSVQSYTDACNDTVAVVASGSTALGTTSAIVLTSSTVQTHGGKPYVPRAYDITPATSAAATVTLYVLQTEFTAYNNYVNSNSLALPLLPAGPTDMTGMSNIVITQYHGSASAGNQGPLGLYSNANVSFIPNSSITVVPMGSYWKLTFPVTGFSGFFIHSGATPLGIDLKNIAATNVGSRNRIDWNTASEKAGDRFELERSIDGNFLKLADIDAKGQPSAYSYWDETPVTGVNYYRLKMIDASGKTTYSKTVSALVRSGTFTVEAYPNPVRDLLSVKVFGERGSDATISVSDITGKAIRTIRVSEDKTDINMAGLAQGVYLIKYSDNEHSQTIRVMKK